MDTQSLLQRCREHGYPSIPTAEQIMRHAVDLCENTDVEYDKLLDLAAVVELHEQMLLKTIAK